MGVASLYEKEHTIIKLYTYIYIYIIPSLIFHLFSFKRNAKEPHLSKELENLYQEKIQRIQNIHDESLHEIQERLHQVKQKAKEELEEYREDIKCERQRRVTDLQRQQAEHQELITALKNEYESNLQRIRELNSTEINMTKDAGEAMRYVKIFPTTINKSLIEYLVL